MDHGGNTWRGGAGTGRWLAFSASIVAVGACRDVGVCAGEGYRGSAEKRAGACIVDHLQTPCSLVSRMTSVYDDRGDALLSRVEEDRGGRVLKRWTYAYDDLGHKTRYAIDVGDGGPEDEVHTWDYPAPLTVAELIEYPASGRASEKWDRQYDEAGHVVQEVREVEGGSRAMTTYAYDSMGKLLLVEVYGSRIEGPPSGRTKYDYDAANGALVAIEFDSPADGILDGSISYRNDQRALPLDIAWDTDGDGRLELEERYSYDEAGRVLTYGSYLDGSAVAYNQRTMTYDPAGRLAELGEGALLERVTTYAYDAAGNTLTESLDTNHDGQPEEIWASDYRCFGD